MKNNVALAVVVAALLVGGILIGASVSGHMMYNPSYYSFQDSGYGEHHREMLDLHKQYFNNEIGYEEFAGMMEKEMLEDGMPCFGGYGMMGPSMMGWR